MFQKILVPTDGSRYAIRAAEVAADLARRYRAEVALLLVSDSQIARSSTPGEAPPMDLQSAIRAANAEALARTKEPFDRAGVAVTMREMEGSPARAIAAEVEAGEYDLIVMGSRGLGLSDDERYLLGSVTERVLRLVTCPVLTVRA